MPKGQQRGNKEVKKPKKGQAAPAALIPTAATPVGKGVPAIRPTKK